MLNIFYTKVQKKYMKPYVDGNHTQVKLLPKIDVVTLCKSAPGKLKSQFELSGNIQLTPYCLQNKCISD